MLESTAECQVNAEVDALTDQRVPDSPTKRLFDREDLDCSISNNFNESKTSDTKFSKPPQLDKLAHLDERSSIDTRESTASAVSNMNHRYWIYRDRFLRLGPKRFRDEKALYLVTIFGILAIIYSYLAGYYKFVVEIWVYKEASALLPTIDFVCWELWTLVSFLDRLDHGVALRKGLIDKNYYKPFFNVSIEESINSVKPEFVNGLLLYANSVNAKLLNLTFPHLTKGVSDILARQIVEVSLPNRNFSFCSDMKCTQNVRQLTGYQAASLLQPVINNYIS